MDKRVKFNLKLRLWAVRSIISGRETCASAAKRIGGNKGTVERWLIVYNEQGEGGLNLKSGNKNGIYSGEFKIKVVRYMLENRLSLFRTAAFFGISSASVVLKWHQIYNRLGEAGLLKETRGRKSILLLNKKKNTKKNSSTTDLPEEKLAALQKEVEYLRAENAFLKKLDALIQQEQAAKALGKQQKSSRN